MNEMNRYGLKDPIVKLERCDKIWKTLQLIRSMQDKHLEDIEDLIKREPVTTFDKKTMSKEPPMTFIPDKTLPLNLIGEPNLPKPYIKYQPIFNNGNESLPQFKLAEKSRVNLYHCEICSQEYCDYKRFIDHQETVHGIAGTNNNNKKFMNNKRDNKIQSNKINGDSKDRRSSTDSNNSQKLLRQQIMKKKLISDENMELEDNNIVRNIILSRNDNIRCNLCGEYYKNIKKHMVDYHKIKYIGVLDKVNDDNSNFHNNNESVIEFEALNRNNCMEKNDIDERKLISESSNDVVNLSFNNFESMKNLSKRKLNMPSIGVGKRIRSDSREVGSDGDDKKKNELFKCEICAREYANYKSLWKHRSRHKHRAHENRQSLGTKKQANDLGQKTRQERDGDNENNNIDHKLTKSKSSFTKESSKSRSDGLENGNMESLGKVEDKILEIKCACGRNFRTTSILANHRAGCKFLSDMDAGKSSEIRTGNERDSGISITIKKKNNSYEIVSKDCNEEEYLLRNVDNNIEKESEICEESYDSSSDNSDSSEFDDQPESLVPEKSKYSENHRILKLEFAEEDEDVDIEDDMDEDYLENDENKVYLKKNEHQVPSLRVLCKKFLIKRGVIPEEKTSHKCRTCNIFLGSRERLSKHLDRHKKLLKRSCNCGIKFASTKPFNDHIAAAHPRCIVCPYCKEKYKSIAALSEHFCAVTQGSTYTEIIKENLHCPNCDGVFHDITSLDNHMRSEHLDLDLPFQCYKCLEKFPNEVARNLHSNQTHDRGSSCSVCNQKFDSAKSGSKHEAYHRGVGFPCHICKKTYRTKRYQLDHARTVHSDYSNNKLECFICQKSIKTKSFRKHVLRHTSSLECEICHKSSSDFRTLERHIMYVHSNENYPRKKCNACGASFPTKEQLEAHVMVEKSVKNKHSKH